MTTIFKILIPAIMGITLSIGASTISSTDIMASAWEAAHMVNRTEIRNALEIYYIDHNSYPIVKDADELFDELYKEQYIDNKPLKPEAYSYSVLDGGERYKFSIR